MWVYLGCWNATVPLIIVQRASLLELATYETTLALCAVMSMLLFASRVEAMRRSTALKAGCMAIVVTGALRYVIVSVWFSIDALIFIDVLAVLAFGVVQPLFGVYPAETVEKYRIASAFRIRRICTTIGRVVGPLLAGAVIAAFSVQASLLFTALVGVAALAVALALPTSTCVNTVRGASPSERVQSMLLGIKLKLVLPPERFLTVSGFMLNLAATAMVPMLVPNFIHTHQLAESSAGLFNALFAIGSVAGLFVLSPLVAKRAHQRNKYIGLWALLIAALCACAQASETWQLAVWLFFAGAASACLSLVGADKRLTSVPSGVRIRLMAATLVVSQGANSASYMVAGGITSQFGTPALLWLYLAIFMVVVVYALSTRRVWRFLEDDADAELYYPNNHPALAASMRT
ncbi:MAG: MFS transporter [Pseudomonas sp.]|uniref:MFS transporter n=1 Tax=Pseudomonas abieticivorans TaxID=2931382 RepID=UPI0020BF1AD6|nr:MFS transporter [Pseudomonas sp. PIA16]MDE1165433.1 MFS transporter [Pseudomonas sp.]